MTATFISKTGLLAVLLASVIFTGCSKNAAREIIGKGLAKQVNTQVGYNAHQCYRVKSECQSGQYQEWPTSDGEEGCSCKKL